MSISVFSKKGCLYCDKAKDLLDELQVPYTVHVLQPEEEGYAEKRDTLFDKYSHRSFPIILVGDVFIGGFTELKNSVATLQFHDLASNIGIDVPMEF
jgi:glutaredoxin